MPVLVVLAAGMGSRYGGCKQMDPVGPNNQTLLDYSVYDAVLAGFDKVVFVIRKDMETAFADSILSRYKGRVPCKCAFQELDALPPGHGVPAGREKPWGTGHAVLVCEPLVDEPFCVINSDDFYGRSAFMQMARFLSAGQPASAVPCFAMVGFLLENTLSPAGSVSRGICATGPDGCLVSVTEREKIERSAQGIQSPAQGGGWLAFSGKEPVSLNFWGFFPVFFGHLKRLFKEFLAEKGLNKTAEFYLPGAVDALVRSGLARVMVLNSQDCWKGVTYKDDKPGVARHLENLVRAGVYPEKLF